MLRELLCRVGSHQYLYNMRGGISTKEEEKQGSLRLCARCGKKQKLDVHCLGLNPPTYVRNWVNISEDKI